MRKIVLAAAFSAVLTMPALALDMSDTTNGPPASQLTKVDPATTPSARVNVEKELHTDFWDKDSPNEL